MKAPGVKPKRVPVTLSMRLYDRVARTAKLNKVPLNRVIDALLHIGLTFAAAALHERDE